MDQVETSRVAEEYRNDGYRLTSRPEGPLPDFLDGFEPDFLAEKASEKVVVAVVTKDELRRREHHLGYWIGKVNAEPGWRFDLVITNPSPWPDKVAKDAREFEVDEIRARVPEARRALAHGLVEPACLFAWALAEAAMRHLARDLGILPPVLGASEVLGQLYSVGNLGPRELKRLERFLTIRNAVAHGMATPDLDEGKVAEILAMTEKFLASAEARHRLAGV